jgi:lysophospholipase L1-like esterase
LTKWLVAVFLGDSLTAGFQQGPGYLPPRYYPFTNMLESRLRITLRELGSNKNISIVNQGIDGDSTRGMLERYTRSIEPETPQIVLLWGGINDLSSMVPTDDVLHNIIQLVERTKQIGAIPIVLNIAPVTGIHFNETIQKLNNMTYRYCNENDLDYLDIFSELIDEQGKLAQPYSNDGVHLSDLGYQKIIPPIYDAIMTHLEILL